MPGGVNTSLRRVTPQLVFARAKGAVMTDVEGKDYIDYQAAFGPIVLGHNHDEVNNRVAEAMSQVDLLGVGTTEWEIELAAAICRHVPSAGRVLFANSGSEATYSAIRLARGVTGRKKIIKFQGCYHGSARRRAHERRHALGQTGLARSPLRRQPSGSRAAHHRVRLQQPRRGRSRVRSAKPRRDRRRHPGAYPAQHRLRHAQARSSSPGCARSPAAPAASSSSTR